MSPAILSVVLFAAVLHASWNAIVKGTADKTAMLGMISVGHVLPGAVMVWIAAPPSMAILPFVLASTVIHWGYYALLNLAYRSGDLSIVYPVARGLAPVLVALGAQFWIGEHLPGLAWAGILCVSAGIMVLASGALRKGVHRAGLIAALGVAVTVAGYSIVDGVGVRLSGSPFAYVGWLFVAEISVVAFVFTTRWDRVRAMSARSIFLGILCGLISGAAYALVLYVKTLAPIGIVSALRETSVIIASLIGVIWFREGPRSHRLFAALIVAAGIILIGIVG